MSRDRDGSQAGTAIEGPVPDGGDGGRDGDRGQAGTVLEGFLRNRLDSVRDDDDFSADRDPVHEGRKRTLSWGLS
jgi:hypothetical protein